MCAFIIFLPAQIDDPVCSDRWNRKSMPSAVRVEFPFDGAGVRGGAMHTPAAMSGIMPQHRPRRQVRLLRCRESRTRQNQGCNTDGYSRDSMQVLLHLEATLH